ncbi:MAG: macro domain-containing protein [Firmicutes bacterium]|nr:macro domain-containing protein [Bacillota bacterium]
MKLKINNTEIELVEGDITEMATDAIVNAANTALILGSGVAGAIRSKGGPSIQEECNRIGGTFTGGAVITGAGNLKTKQVIHAVGPIMGEGDEEEKLQNAAYNSLLVADKYHLKSVALPAISTGVYGFPMERCAEIMLRTAVEYAKGATAIEQIVFCLYGNSAFNVFAREIKKYGEAK